MKTIQCILAIVLGTTLASAQSSQTYVRDHTSTLWHGQSWRLNPIKNKKLLYQNAIVPYVAEKNGMIDNPEPAKPMLCRWLLYVSTDAPDQTLAELRPKTDGPATAAIRLQGDRLVIELFANTESGWLNKTIHLDTDIPRNRWVSKEILFIPTSQQQTIGWSQTVNQPTELQYFTGTGRMIRQAEEMPWRWETIQLIDGTGWELGELAWDRDITHSKTESANIQIQ